jgi:choline dehydrogenase-like flavoprotein
MKYPREQVSPSPKYPTDSGASENSVLGLNTEDEIVYSLEDNAAIEQLVRETVQTAFHSMGTCKMAPREKKGVVDAALSVYGTKGLKIADLSISPENVSGNTMNTALLIGEKAADIFIQELGLGR